MTQYLLSVFVPDDVGEDMSPDQMEAIYKQVDEFNAELKTSGAWVFAGGLHPASSATVVKVENGDATTTDGPYAETKEQLGGFWVIEAPDLDAALALATKASAACEGAVEVRPFQDEPAE
jgi:hypothetical protein